MKSLIGFRREPNKGIRNPPNAMTKSPMAVDPAVETERDDVARMASASRRRARRVAHPRKSSAERCEDASVVGHALVQCYGQHIGERSDRYESGTRSRPLRAATTPIPKGPRSRPKDSSSGRRTSESVVLRRRREGAPVGDRRSETTPITAESDAGRYPCCNSTNQHARRELWARALDESKFSEWSRN